MRLKQNFIAIIVGVLLANLLIVYLPQSASAYSGEGSGTQQDPYMVYNCTDLQQISTNLSATYALANDINCSATSSWNSGQGFIPIGNFTDRFTGTLDGQNFSVTGLYINSTSGENVGLFGNTLNATIKRIHLDGGSVNSTNAGYNGTLAGWTTGTTFSDCSSTADMSAVGSGGLVGLMQGGAMDRCWYDGSVEAPSNTTGYTAGLVKGADGAEFNNVYTKGYLHGRTYSGALFGFFDNSNITNAYSSMTVDTESTVYAGGLFGTIGGFDSEENITNVFFAGSFDDSQVTNPGAITPLGSSGTTFTNVYYDVTACGCTQGIYSNHGTGVINEVNIGGSQPSYFVNNSTNPPLNNWNFSTVWQTNSGGMPTLRPASNGTMLCSQPQATATASKVHCDMQYSGQSVDLGTTTWRARYRKVGDTDWIYKNVPVSNEGIILINNLEPNTNYQIGLGPTNNLLRIWGYVEVSNASAVTDSDSDGVSDTIEDSASSNGDINGDNELDSLQQNITNALSPVNGKNVVLEGTCATNQSVSVGAESTDRADFAFNYPAGLMSFKLACGTPGTTATVTQYFIGDYDPNKLAARKWNSVKNSYTTINGAQVTAATLDGKKAVKVVYQVTDGGELDQDAKADGTITDPAGIAESVVGTPNTGIFRSR